MTKQANSALAGTRFAVYAMAFAWPWGVYEVVPGLWMPLSTVLGMFVVGVCIIDVIRRKRFDIPFDMLWPVVAWLAITGIARDFRYREVLDIVRIALVFLATVYATRSRETVANCLWLSMLAGTCVAALTLASRAGFLLPTVYIIDAQGIQETYARLATSLFASPPSFAFAQTLSSGFCTLLVCGTIAMYAVTSSGISRAAKWFTVAATLLIAIALLANALPAWERVVEWRPLEGLRTSWIEATASVAVLWLAARIVMRNAVALKQSRTSVSHPVVSCVAAGVMAWIALPYSAEPVHGFLLGIAAAYGLRDAPEPSSAPARLWLVSPIVVLAMFNVWAVSPENRADPRHYEAAIVSDVQRGERDLALDRIATLRALGVQERGLYLAQARVALAYERPHWAAHALAQAVDFSEQGRTILPAPSSDDVQRFLTALREFLSHTDDSGASLAQEAALLAAGQSGAALSLLESKARETTNLALLETPEDRAAEALAFLLGAPELGKELRGWPHDRLCATLDRIGARVEPVPEGYPVELLPMVVAYRPTANGYAVRVWTKVRQVAAEVPMLWTAPLSPPPDAATVAWKQAAPIGSEWWRFTLSLRPGAQAIAVAIGKDGGVTIEANPLPLEALPDDEIVLIMR